MSGATAIPNGLVDNDNDLVNVWFAYGQHGVRGGFLPVEKTLPVVMGEFTDKECRKDNVTDTLKCGPFRADYYGAPLWFPFRDRDTSDLPPR